MEKRIAPPVKVIMDAFARNEVITGLHDIDDVLSRTAEDAPVFVHAYYIEAVRAFIETQYDENNNACGFTIKGRAAFCVYPDQTISQKQMTGYINTNKYGDKLLKAELLVNWAACGSQDLATTRDFANRLLAMCNELEAAVVEYDNALNGAQQKAAL